MNNERFSALFPGVLLWPNNKMVRPFSKFVCGLTKEARYGQNSPFVGKSVDLASHFDLISNFGVRVGLYINGFYNAKPTYVYLRIYYIF